MRSGALRALIVIVAAAIGAAIVWMWWSRGHDQPGDGQASDSDRAAVTVLEETLNTGDEGQLREVLAIPEGVELEAGFIDGITAARPFVLEVDQLETADGASATVPAITGPDSEPTTWIAHLVKEGDRWKLVATEPAP